MRRITLFIIHCSATRCGQPYSFEDCRRDHIDGRHFRDIGYHYYIPPRPAALPGGGALLRPQPSQHRHLLRRGAERRRPPGRHPHACPEGSLGAVGARVRPAIPGSPHRRAPRLEPAKSLPFVRRGEGIQKRRTPWEALRPPRECVSFTRLLLCAFFLCYFPAGASSPIFNGVMLFSAPG